MKMTNGVVANAENAVPWDFAARPAADLVVINIGTNDQSYNVTNDAYQENLTKLIEGVHGVWPDAQVLIMVKASPLTTQTFLSVCLCTPS